MTPKIQINNEAEVCHIEIEGTIGVPEEWQFEEPDSRVATYERFREEVARIAEIKAPKVIVTIRSTGGDVNDALLIHDALRQIGGHITTRCYGYTASAATIIAQAASEGARYLSANALYLIHRATCSAEGNAAQIGEQLALLESTDERLAALYAARSGAPIEQFRALMEENNGNGRWLSPQEAIEAGLADRIIDPATDFEEEHTNPDSTEEFSEESTDTASVSNGWQRLMKAIGLRNAPAQPTPPEPDNTVHFDRPQAELRRRRIASAALLKQYGPTRAASTDDPSFGDQLRSANERAYAEDLKQLLRR